MAKPTKHRGEWRIRYTEPTGRRSQVFEHHDDAELALRRLELQRLEIQRGLRPVPPPPEACLAEDGYAEV